MHEPSPLRRLLKRVASLPFSACLPCDVEPSAAAHIVAMSIVCARRSSLLPIVRLEHEVPFESEDAEESPSDDESDSLSEAVSLCALGHIQEYIELHSPT